MRNRALVLSTLIALGTPLAAAADEAFEASVALSAVEQVGPAVDKLKVGNDAVINVARGRDAEAAVPDNEVLVLVVDCEAPEIRLSVLDTVGPTELVKIAVSGEVDFASDAKSGAVVARLDIATAGGEDNRFDGGYLVLAGGFKPDPGGCPTSLKGAVSGVLDVTLTVEGVTAPVTALVTKGKLGSGSAPIATVP